MDLRVDGFCSALGMSLPVVQAPIGSASTPQLAAAVSQAGGLGMLALSWASLDETRHRIQATQRLTSRPFGVNLALEWAQFERLAVCLEEGVQIVSTFWVTQPSTGTSSTKPARYTCTPSEMRTKRAAPSTLASTWSSRRGGRPADTCGVKLR